MKDDYRCVTDMDSVREYLRGHQIVSFDFETAPDDSFREEEKAALDPARAHICTMSLSVAEHSAIMIPVAHRRGPNMDETVFKKFLKDFLTDTRITKICHNYVFESSFSYKEGIVIMPPVYDTMCAAQMTLKAHGVFRTLSDSGLKTLALNLCKEPLPSFTAVTEGRHFDELDSTDPETIRYSCADADFALRLYHFINRWFDRYLPKQNVSNVSWQALNERFKTAELFGKLANIFADLPTKNIDDNGIFKALVGEDYLTVEKKNKNPFSFQSSARLLFSCNSIPKNYGDRSEGFYRRLIIIRFNYTVPQDKRDPELLEKFRIEADGIFLFALEGLRRLMENQYVFSETQVNADELQQYREESDSVLSFVKEYCVLDGDGSCSSTELFNTYKHYCEECGLKPYSHKSFVQQITTAFPGVERGIDHTARRRILNGIRLGEVLG